MADEPTKMPWESKTELVAFIGVVAGLIASFNLIDTPLTETQIAGIATILYVIIMIVRIYGGGKISFSMP